MPLNAAETDPICCSPWFGGVPTDKQPVTLSRPLSKLRTVGVDILRRFTED